VSTGDPARGITCPDMRRIVREALHHGWVWDGWTGTTHARIVWPETGDRLVFGCTPGVASWKSLATDIRRVSGVVVWRKGNHRRSRKAVTRSGFTIAKAQAEQAQWHRGSYGKTVDELMATRDRLIERCHRLAEDRGTIRSIPEVLAVIGHLEDKLQALHQPVEPFDPFTLRH